MDKRKEKRIEELKEKFPEKFPLTRPDRENIINLMLEIELQQEAIKSQQKHINDMKIQQTTGTVRQRDKFGNLIDKQDLWKFIEVYEHDLKRMKWVLLKLMDNLFYAIQDKDSEELKNQFYAHYQLVQEEYEKFKKVYGDINV